MGPRHVGLLKAEKSSFLFVQQCTAGERNSHIFQKKYKPWEEIVVMITRDTGKRFLSWRDAVDDAPKSR